MTTFLKSSEIRHDDIQPLVIRRMIFRGSWDLIFLIYLGGADRDVIWLFTSLVASRSYDFIRSERYVGGKKSLLEKRPFTSTLPVIGFLFLATVVE